MRVVSDAALTAFDTSYQLGSTIAAGAYGQVCRSICRQTGRPVALKIIEKPPYETIPPCISDMAGHGPEEAETMELIANLDIDGVPKILDVFEDCDATYIVSELGGLDLYEWLRRRSTVREDATILSVIMQLLTILDSLHGWGISHNDIKLENILLNDSGDVHLVDFGSAVVCACTHHAGLRRQVLQRDQHDNDDDCFVGECSDAVFSERCEDDFLACAVVMYQLFTGSPLASIERRESSTPKKKAALRRVSKGELLSAEEVRGLFEQID